MCFAHQTFSLMPQFLLQYSSIQNVEQKLAAKMNKLLFGYKSIENLQYLSPQSNTIEIQTDQYVSHLRFEGERWLLYSLRVDTYQVNLSLENQVWISYTRDDQLVFRFMEELKTLNKDLELENPSHPQLLRYINMRICKICFYQEFYFNHSFDPIKVNILRLNPLEANNNHYQKIFNLVLEHPNIKPLSRNFIQLAPQIVLTLLFPNNITEVHTFFSINQFDQGQEIKVRMEFPQTTISDANFQKTIINGNKRVFMKLEFNQMNGVVHQSHVRELQPTQQFYQEFAESLNEWLQFVNCEKNLLKSVQSYKRIGADYRLIAYQPFFSNSIFPKSIVQEEGVALEELFDEKSTDMCFQLNSSGSEFLYSLLFDGEQVRKLLLKDRDGQRFIFITEVDKTELKSFIMAQSVFPEDRYLSWLTIRDVVRKIKLDSWKCILGSTTVEFHRVFNKTQIRGKGSIEEASIVLSFEHQSILTKQLERQVYFKDLFKDNYQTLENLLKKVLQDFVLDICKKVR